MSLTREEICRRLSPSTLGEIRDKQRHAPFSLLWTMNGLMIIFSIVAGLLISEYLIQAILCFGCALLCFAMRWHAQKEPTSAFAKLKQYAKVVEIARVECKTLTDEIVSTVCGKSELKEFFALRTIEVFNKWIQEEKQRPTSITYLPRYGHFLTQPDQAHIDSLERSKKLMHEKTDLGYLDLKRQANPDSVPDEVYQEASSRSQLADAQYAYVQKLKCQLNEKIELYLSFLERPLRPDYMDNITRVVHDYATIALEALEHPFPSIEQAA